MQTPEALKRKIQSAQDLLGVVKTMKALAAVSIRQYQRAVESLADYNRTVEMGLQIVLKESRQGDGRSGATRRRDSGRLCSARTRGSAASSTTSSSSTPSKKWTRRAFRKKTGSSSPWACERPTSLRTRGRMSLKS